MAGRVLALHAKGVPPPGEHGIQKPNRPELSVTAQGVDGDFNRFRTEKLAGDLDSALLLIPIETIRGLNAEGWPVRDGDLGENITTEGVAYDALAPEGEWRIGTVVARTTRACEPCHYLHDLPYVGTARGAEFVRTMIGRRGWYARVVTPGRIRVGDPIERL